MEKHNNWLMWLFSTIGICFGMWVSQSCFPLLVYIIIGIIHAEVG
jgi:hypothetical protein